MNRALVWTIFRLFGIQCMAVRNETPGVCVRFVCRATRLSENQYDKHGHVCLHVNCILAKICTTRRVQACEEMGLIKGSSNRKHFSTLYGICTHVLRHCMIPAITYVRACLRACVFVCLHVCAIHTCDMAYSYVLYDLFLIFSMRILIFSMQI